MSHHRAAQEIAAPGEEEALARIGRLAALDDEVLGMDVECVGCASAHRRHRVVVHAQEVAHVHQLAEIIVRHRVDQLLHPQAVLRDEAVVLRHGLDALLCRILRHGQAALCQALQDIVVSMVGSVRNREYRIMAHGGAAQDGGDVHLGFQALHLGLQIALAAS